MKILIIQTAFTGDVVLATPVIEKLHHFFPESEIHFLLRKGNENLLETNPNVQKIICWNKKRNKRRELLAVISEVRKVRYDLLVNLHRYFSSGLVTVLSRAEHKIGFKKNPLSLFFDERHRHVIHPGEHEVIRNLSLIAGITDTEFERPVLYLSDEVEKRVAPYKINPYLTIAPGSVWQTKQFPVHKWISFLDRVRFRGKVYLIGGVEDRDLGQQIAQLSGHAYIQNLCGDLSLLESAALMKHAVMNYTNDSAPLHLASAVNAPTCAVFCSTVPAFGFGPLSDSHFIIETGKSLKCRPCGLHGHPRCPEGHFECAEGIEVDRLMEVLKK